MTIEQLFNPETIPREQLAIMRRKCDNSLLYFTRLFYFATERKKFIFNWHHKELCGHFEDFADYKVELLNINIPPRCSKTLIMMMCICRSIGMRHSSNSLYITASDNLRKKTTTDIRRILTHPLFKRMYGLEIMKDQNSKDVIGFVGGGSLTTASIFGQITGFGAGEMTERPSYTNTDGSVEYLKTNNHLAMSKFEGGIYCDDLNKIKDSEAQNANNDAVTDVMFSTVFSRKNSSDTPIANIQQRAGLTDVSNALIEYYGLDNERARFVVMPVIYPDGRLLWEWRYPLDAVLRLKKGTATAHIFETQYMQNPQPSVGAMFRADELNYFDIEDIDEDRIMSRIGCIDVADEGKDYLSFPSGCLIGEKFYVTDWIYTQDNMKITVPQSSSIINQNKIDHIGVETNSFGIAFYRELKDSVTNYTTLYPNYETFNKHSRIINKEVFIKDFFVFRKDVDPLSDYGKAMQHLVRYMRDKSFKIDDAPDSLASVATLILHLFEEFN